MQAEEWAGIHPKLEKARSIAIQNLLESANFSYLEKRACTIRDRIEGPLESDRSCKIDLEKSNFTHGCHNVVLKVHFSDGVCWLARIPYSTSYSPDKFEIEVETMRQIRQHTSIPVPEVYDSDSTSNSPLGYPYMLIEQKPGLRANKHYHFFPREHQRKVATQIAEILSELMNIRQSTCGFLQPNRQPMSSCLLSNNPTEGGTIDGSFEPKAEGGATSSYEYFYAEKFSNLLQEIPKECANKPEVTAALQLFKLAIGQFLRLNLSRGPFPLSHIDFGTANVLFDEDYNITGVIDWTNAQTVPFEALLAQLELHRNSVLSKEMNQQIFNFRRMVAEALEAKFRANSTEAKAVDSQRNQGSEKKVCVWRRVLNLGKPVAENWLSPCAAFLLSEDYELACHIQHLDPSSMVSRAKEIAKVMFGDGSDWKKVVEILGKQPSNNRSFRRRSFQ